MQNRERLIALGSAIHGELWQNATARDLGVNPRQVHRWVSGAYSPSDGVIRDLIRIAEAHAARLKDAMRTCAI